MISQVSVKRRALLSLITAAPLLSFAALGETADVQAPDADEAQIIIRERKERCSSYAENIKKHYKSDTEVYKTTLRLYENARIKNNAYVEQVAEMIRNGH